MLRSLHIGVLAFLLGACASAKPVTDGVLFRADSWSGVLDAGFAVSPIVAAHPVEGGTDATATVTREFFLAMQGSSPGTPLMGPDSVYSALEAIGPAAHARLRALRRATYREDPLDPGPLARLRTDLGQRYLLVGWMDEGTAEGVQSTVKDDFTAFQYQMHVHGYSTEELQGRVTAIVVDLEQAQVVWRGSVPYLSGWLDWDDPVKAEAEIHRTRAAAVVELASLLGAPSVR